MMLRRATLAALPPAFGIAGDATGVDAALRNARLQDGKGGPC